MFLRMLGKSLKVRKNHFVVAIVAVSMAALLVAATSTISLNIKAKIGRELRSYGPNLTILPISSALTAENGALSAAQDYLRQQDASNIEQDPEVVGLSAALTGTASVNSREVTLVGLNWQDAVKLHPWWELSGKESEGTNLVMGQQLAKNLNLTVGQSLTLSNGKKILEATLAGIVRTGGDEDNQVLLALGTAQNFLGQEGKLSELQVSVLNSKVPIEEKGKALANKLPGSRSKVNQQVAQAEQGLLKKIQALMYFVTGGVLVVSLLSIAGTMSTTVLQRRKEIGILKAIGAADRDIAGLFLGEASVFALLGGTLGLAAGMGLAQVIAVTVFKTDVRFSPLVVPLTLGTACLVTWLASVRPVLQAVSVQPAAILRGE